MKPLWLAAVPPFLVHVITGRLQLTEMVEVGDEATRPPQARSKKLRVSERAETVALRTT